MNCAIADKKSGAYDSSCITKLLWNFRSHPKLLELPSKMFYDSELVPKADPVLTESLIRYHFTPKQQAMVKLK
jgi:helicase MOV-10